MIEAPLEILPNLPSKSFKDILIRTIGCPIFRKPRMAAPDPASTELVPALYPLLVVPWIPFAMACLSVPIVLGVSVSHLDYSF